MSDFRLDQFLPYQLAALANRTSRAFAAIYGERFGLTVPEWRVMAHLGSKDRISVRDIHMRVDMDKSKVTRAAQRLVARGLIAKTINPTDRRLVTLSLTAKGRSMMDQIAPLALAFEKEMLSQLSPEVVAAFRDTIARLGEQDE